MAAIGLGTSASTPGCNRRRGSLVFYLFQPRMARRKICLLSELSPGRTRKFEFWREGLKREGFIARSGEVLVAYENICRHLPIPLDAGNGNFFTSNHRYFICQTHGAIYEPGTGLCVRGPCEGLSLKRIAIEVKDHVVWLVEDGTDAQAPAPGFTDQAAG